MLEWRAFVNGNRFHKKIRDSKNEDTKSYWYLFCFRFIKFPSGVHDLSPNACVNLLITQV
ncbi:hypothetical protein BSB_40810 [Bacillus stercoris]|nr:hypothetical protein BSB_40810 [Bacillus stercoris]